MGASWGRLVVNWYWKVTLPTFQILYCQLQCLSNFQYWKILSQTFFHVFYLQRCHPPESSRGPNTGLTKSTSWHLHQSEKTPHHGTKILAQVFKEAYPQAPTVEQNSVPTSEGGKYSEIVRVADTVPLSTDSQPTISKDISEAPRLRVQLTHNNIIWKYPQAEAVTIIKYKNTMEEPPTKYNYNIKIPVISQDKEEQENNEINITPHMSIRIQHT